MAKKRIPRRESIPEVTASLVNIAEDSKIFVDKSKEIADYIYYIMEVQGLKQKDLADKMGKTEAEVSKFLAGMHNFTLRSLSKIEAALGVPVIIVAQKKTIKRQHSN